MEELDIQTIGRRSVKSVGAVISRQFILYAISFATSLVLITFLSPKDLGIYAVVVAMQSIISFFTDFGLGAALVQSKNPLTNDDLKTTFTLQTIITFAIFVVVLILSGPIAGFFKLDAAGVRLLLAFVFTIFLSSFKIIPSILLERAIKFEKLVIPHIAEAVIYNAVLIVLVLQGLRLDAYFWAVLLAGIGGIPFYYFISFWKISFGIKRSSIHHLHYGVQFQAKNILATVKDDLLTVMLAKFLPFASLGYINTAQGFAFYPFRFVTDSVTKVTFSTYARIQGHEGHTRTAIEKSLFFVSGIMFPLMLGLILTGPYFIHFIPKWHAKWEPAIVSLVFFSLNAMVSSLSNVLINVLDASGKVKTTLQLMVVWTFLTWFLTLALIKVYGYNGVAIASFIVTLTIVFTVYLVKKIVKFDFFKSIYKPTISSLVMVAVTVSLTKLFVSNIPTLIVTIIIAGLVYAGSLYLLSGKELKEDFRFIFPKV
ncbi:MAG TPA: oligosaccharide flippase family protein [Candidatus Saccharimonadales bacterium]|nr:oligosaccharide flippase family protein [Candidatus Saccharimonadales bacterium]